MSFDKSATLIAIISMKTKKTRNKAVGPGMQKSKFLLLLQPPSLLLSLKAPQHVSLEQALSPA